MPETTQRPPRPDAESLAATVDEVRRLVTTRFPDGSSRGAAAALLADGSIVSSTSPDFINPSVTVCHEIGCYAEAFTRDQAVVASVCLHRREDGTFVVLSPCGVCRERLASYGGEVLVAVPGEGDPSQVAWVELREALPHYWMRVFPDLLRRETLVGSWDDAESGRSRTR